MKGLRPSTARAAEPCVLKARKAAERMSMCVPCSMRKTKRDVPAKCPIEELPCGFHLEVATPGDLSTMARVQNKPFDSRAVRVNVAYGAHCARCRSARQAALHAGAQPSPALIIFSKHPSVHADLSRLTTPVPSLRSASTKLPSWRTTSMWLYVRRLLQVMGIQFTHLLLDRKVCIEWTTSLQAP